MLGDRIDIAATSLERAFAGELAKCLDAVPQPPRTLVAGVSGGLDSVCLAHLLAAALAGAGITLHMAHFDHALRPSSAEDAAFVESLAQRLGASFSMRRATSHDTGGLGIEAWARRARYQFLGETARTVTSPGEMPVVVVAHHADDQAETVLLNEARGVSRQPPAGMEAVARLPEQPPGEPGILLRPLLGFRRRALLEYAEARGLTWREDETNAVPNRLRTHIRHVVLPELEREDPAAVARLARVAEESLAARQAMAGRVEAALARAQVEAVAGVRLLLRLDVLAALDEPLRRALVAEVLRRDFPQALANGMPWLETLAWQIAQNPGAGGPWPIAGGVSWTRLAGTETAPAAISIHGSRSLPVSPPGPWLDDLWRAAAHGAPVALVEGRPIVSSNGWRLEVQRDSMQGRRTDWSAWTALLDAKKCCGLALTTPQPGMRIAPVGMGGHTRSLGDVFTDRRTPRALRPGWPVLVEEESGRVLWLCGMIVSEYVRIDAATTSVLRLHWVEEERGDPT